MERDGTPTVLLDYSNQTEEMVVHELFHLKLIYQGFPELRWRMWLRENEIANDKLFQMVQTLISDTIHHWLFYPEMRRMGLDPGKGNKQDLKNAMERGYFENVTTENEWLFLPLFYFKDYLELDDKNFLAQVREWYGKKHWENYLKTAEELVRVVIIANPTTPRMEYETFLRCANIIGQGRMKFDGQDWRTETKGTFNQHIAPYLVTPLIR